MRSLYLTLLMYDWESTGVHGRWRLAGVYWGWKTWRAWYTMLKISHLLRNDLEPFSGQKLKGLWGRKDHGLGEKTREPSEGKETKISDRQFADSVGEQMLTGILSTSFPLFFFSVFWRSDWQNCKILKAYFMVIWYTIYTVKESWPSS